MEKYLIPGRDDVSASDQVLFDTLEKRIGFVPNLYAYYAKNATALIDLLALENRKSSLNAKEKEVVNLVEPIQWLQVLCFCTYTTGIEKRVWR